MAGKFTVSLGKIIDEFHLETIYMPKDPTEILIDENDVTRPGLQLWASMSTSIRNVCRSLVKWSLHISPRSTKKLAPSVWTL